MVEITKRILIFLMVTAIASPMTLENISENWLDGYTMRDFGEFAAIYGLTRHANWEFTSNYAGHRIKDADKIITTEKKYKYILGKWFIAESSTKTTVTTIYDIIQLRSPDFQTEPNSLDTQPLTEEEVERALNPAGMPTMDNLINDLLNDPNNTFPVEFLYKLKEK